MNQPVFTPGFRLSRLDAAVLVVGAGSSVALGAWLPWLGVMLAAVLVHFFLFCNVFRIPRFLELAWAALFVLASAPVLLRGVPPWYAWLAVVSTSTVAVIAIAMRLQSYHGVFWRVINPDLLSWWETHEGRKSRA